MTPRRANMALYGGIALAVLALSQLSGWWVDNSIAVNTTVELNRFLHLTHIRNHGGVFGLGQGMGWLFGLLSAILLAAVTAWLCFSESAQRHEYICLGFIAGGGASNVLDRLLRGSVVDFIDVQHVPGWNYIFNTADLMVHAGIWPLLFLSLYYERRRRREA